MPGSFRLPAYEVPNKMLDLAPLNSALDGYQQQMNTNAQFGMQKKRDDREQETFDDAKKQRAIDRMGKIAEAASLEQDPNRRAAMMGALYKMHPELTAKLIENDIDPKDHGTTAQFLKSQVSTYSPLGERAQLQNIEASKANVAQSQASTSVSQAQLKQLKSQTPEARAQAAGNYGLQPGTPEYNQFVISGQYTPKSNRVTLNEGQTIGDIVPDGAGNSTFKPIVQGNEKAPAEHTAKAANFAARMVESERNIRKLLDGVDPIDGAKGPQFGAADKSVALTSPLPEVARNMVISGPHQQYRQAAEQWIRAFLRKESGAAIGADEFKRDFVVYFPQPGDAPDTIKQKQVARAAAMSGIAGEAGNYFNKLNPDAAKHLNLYKGAGQSAQPNQPDQSGQPKRVNSVEEAMSLPPGTPFMTPDGRMKVR